VRALFAPGDFIEVFLDTPPNICEARDPKGHYKKARSGSLQQFTGVSSPYEAPVAQTSYFHPPVPRRHSFAQRYSPTSIDDSFRSGDASNQSPALDRGQECVSCQRGTRADLSWTQ
jgi:hypothetical protein